MAEPTYLLTISAITFSITFALRAVPFAVLGTLQGPAWLMTSPDGCRLAYWASWQ
jgi:uncharacterized membrane protein